MTSGEVAPSSGLGRRGFLGAMGAAGAVAAVGVSASPAAAATVTPYTKTPLPTAKELHALSRLTYGYTPAALAELRAAGSPEAWIAQQMNPSAIADGYADGFDTWWKSLSNSPAQIVANNNDQSEPAWVAMMNYVRWAMLKRIYSKRQLLEQMAEFWENHLYIPRNDDGVFPFRTDFALKLKALAFSSFEEMLLMSTTHPAMGMSLDNARSTKKAINENLGRELLELHTVGQGHYSEEDVKNSARILTGYRVDAWNTWTVAYDPNVHYVGPVTVMDFSHANSTADGRACTEAYLKYLARHPGTAHRIAYKLCRRFVSDDPSADLVDKLATVYLANNTQIKPVLQALFSSQEFWASGRKKVKTPTDEVASLYRTLGPTFAAPVNGDSAANGFIWHTEGLGQMPFDWPRPDGPPTGNAAWVNPSRFLSSWEIHWTVSGGWWPRQDISWIKPADRLPETSMAFSQLVDHYSRMFLGEASTPTLLDAACSALKVTPDSVVNSSSQVVTWKTPMLISLFINHPNFYLR